MILISTKKFQIYRSIKDISSKPDEMYFTVEKLNAYMHNGTNYTKFWMCGCAADKNFALTSQMTRRCCHLVNFMQKKIVSREKIQFF